jgi:hypothetical protein
VIDVYLPRVSAVRYLGGHTLWLQFADGVEGEVDLANSLHGKLFDAIRDPVAFGEVSVDQGVLVWPGGMDWSPESLYDRVLAANPALAERIGAARAAEVASIARMPELSRFFGIVVRMLADDHAPPHFHASYGEFRVSITIGDATIKGHFPRRALRLVLEWHDLHRDELLANWQRLRAGQEAQPIEPLA